MSDKAREIAFKAWCDKHFLIFIENAFTEGNAIEHPVITCFNEHYDIIESQRRTIEEKDKELKRLRDAYREDHDKWIAYKHSDRAYVEQLQARMKLLEDALRPFASPPGDYLENCRCTNCRARFLITPPGEKKP